MVDDATWSKTVTQDHQYDFTIYETDGEDDLDLLMNSNSYIGFVSTDSQSAWSKALKSFSSDDYAKNFQSFIGFAGGLDLHAQADQRVPQQHHRSARQHDLHAAAARRYDHHGLIRGYAPGPARRRTQPRGCCHDCFLDCRL
jgi:hypothetical protein